MSADLRPSSSGAGPWIDIDLGALRANYRLIRHLANSAEVGAVVKCDAYGFGLAKVARALGDEENCRTFFVAYPREGAALRDTLRSDDVKIYVFHGPTAACLSLFENARLTPVLNSIEQARLWAQARPGAPAAAHIDTGMNRLGAPMSEAGAIASINDLSIELVMSHLACASDPLNAMNDLQRERFIEAADKFPGARACLSASGGAMMDQRFHFDLVRPGIALYGGTPFDVDDARLKPVARLMAPIIQTRALQAGETVGYGATFTAPAPLRLATVALGYGDGFPRAGSGRAHASIRGERAPMAGRVSMDLITLDVTEIKTAVQPGDIATFFGDTVSLFEAAAACDTIGYELLTGLGGRVVRRYV